MKLWEIIKKIADGEIKSNDTKYYFRVYDGQKIILAIENSNILFYDEDCETPGDQNFIYEDHISDWEEV